MSETDTKVVCGNCGDAVPADQINVCETCRKEDLCHECLGIYFHFCENPYEDAYEFKDHSE